MKILGKLKAIDWVRVFDKVAIFSGYLSLALGFALSIWMLYFSSEPLLIDLFRGLFFIAIGAVNLHLIRVEKLVEVAELERSYDLLIKLAELEASAGRTEIREGVVRGLVDRLDRRMGTTGVWSHDEDDA